MSEYASNIRRMESQVIESQQQAHNSRRKVRIMLYNGLECTSNAKN